ncbi:unnamed protein product, partial [Tuber aestivum]
MTTDTRFMLASPGLICWGVRLTPIAPPAPILSIWLSTKLRRLQGSWKRTSTLPILRLRNLLLLRKPQRFSLTFGIPN